MGRVESSRLVKPDQTKLGSTKSNNSLVYIMVILLLYIFWSSYLNSQLFWWEARSEKFILLETLFFSSISWSISYKATSLFFCIEYPTSLILHSLRNIKFFSLKKNRKSNIKLYLGSVWIQLKTEN